jgi:hypothetical protein
VGACSAVQANKIGQIKQVVLNEVISCQFTTRDSRRLRPAQAASSQAKARGTSTLSTGTSKQGAAKKKSVTPVVNARVRGQKPKKDQGQICFCFPDIFLMAV